MTTVIEMLLVKITTALINDIRWMLINFYYTSEHIQKEKNEDNIKITPEETRPKSILSF